jgi:outer membrane protein assembly factor BamA
MRRRAAGAVWLASLFTGGEARADDALPATSVTAPPSDPGSPPVGLPGFMANKRKLDAFDLSQKVEGGYPTPLPLFDVDPDTGIGLGVRVYYYWDGTKADPFYDYTPYRHELSVMSFVTTNGYQLHQLDYDGPYLGNSPFRLRANLNYEKNIAENYFGRGESTLQPLTFPGGHGASFTSFDAYTQALGTPQRGYVSNLYNKYFLEDPSLTTTVERDFFGGLVRIQAGLIGQYVRVVDYTFESVENPSDAVGQPFDLTEAPTKLHADCQAGTIVGCAGGWNDQFKVGIAFDTRDYEPDPNSGFFIDATAEIATKALGSSYDYARVTTSPRVFWSPFPKWTDLVLAGRVAYSVQTNGTPFFSMNTLAFTDGDKQGLGGSSTLRGYNQDRFVGPVVALTNAEIRWTFVNFSLLRQRFGLGAVSFLDFGRVFDRVGDFTFLGWKRGEGAGLRVAWNQATIVRADFAFSTEGFYYYIDFGHVF